MRDLRQLCLLERGLPALRAFVAVEKLGEILGLVGDQFWITHRATLP